MKKILTKEEAKKAIKDWRCTAFPDGVEEQLKEPEIIMCGNWLSTESNEEWWGNMYICNFCKGEMIGASPYCPWCGKEMEVNNG